MGDRKNVFYKIIPCFNYIYKYLYFCFRKQTERKWMALNEQEILRGVNSKGFKSVGNAVCLLLCSPLFICRWYCKRFRYGSGYRSGYFDQDLEFRPDLSGYQRIDLVFISLDLQQCPVPSSYPGFPSEYFT